ncbi:DUF2130 domain-containing protein [Aestuariivirga sp.]|uniref:DUF2130 domain-containing protein n=1 Tax=Aestuariivirga sp. TaxID=2650926 RepID=UPI0039E43A83
MAQNTDPQITCPHCKSEIKLTESLAAPLLAATKADYEKRLQSQSEMLAKERADLLQQQSKLAHAAAHLEEQVSERLQAERAQLVAQEQKRVRSTVELEMKQQADAVKDLQDRLKQRDEKLAAAQKQQAEFMAKERALEDQKRELEITIAERVKADSETIRQKAQAEAEQALRLKVAEKDEAIEGMKRQIEELKRRAEQGSQQLQGEVLELDFEQQLQHRFPMDRVAPVPKGEIGADLVQEVLTATGQSAGTIIWELKRAKNWSEGWLAKLRDDQRSYPADVAVLVSAALPKGVERLDVVDAVHVVHPREALALAAIIRAHLLDIARVKLQQVGQAGKMEQMYDYLTGPHFKHRVDAIIENFRAQQKELEKEKAFMLRQWAKREKNLFNVLEATSGMYGDMQGIAGSSMQAIAALDHMAGEDGEETE